MKSLLPRSAIVAAIGVAACVNETPTATRTGVSGADVASKVAFAASWTQAISIELLPPGASTQFNTPSLDGCPLPSRDGLLFFIASDRAGGNGGRDIWVSSRASTTAPWGAPKLVGQPISTQYNDFCPMLAGDGETFYFVSDRPGGCGGTDIYVSHRNEDGTFTAPKNLGCDVNSAGNEEGPVPGNEPRNGKVLYFSSARAGGFASDAVGATPDFDLYVSVWRAGKFQAPTLVANVNSAVNDGQPFLSDDSRELYFYSNRAGGYGGNDIWVASRDKTKEAWGTPVNVGPSVNTANPETRPSLSSDGTHLYFGSTRPAPVGEGSSDVYVSVRERGRGE